MTDLQIGGRVPAPRSFHTLTAVGNKAVLFGGRGKNDKHFANFDVFDFGMAAFESFLHHIFFFFFGQV